MLKERLQQDLKSALLSGNKVRAEVIRGLKSAILYEEVAKGAHETGLNDEALLAVFARESKKRAESAEVYEKAGAHDRAETELAEKAIIDEYLPAQLEDQALSAIVRSVMQELGAHAQMGQIIGVVKRKIGQSADGGRIAAAVKTAMQQ